MFRRAAPAALVFLVLPLLVAPGLLWGETFWLRDAWRMLWPLRDRCGAMLAECRWPLWTSDAAAGIPLLGNPSTGALYPLNILLPWLPSGVGLGWFAAVHLAIAGLGARWCAREYGASARASWLAGVAYALSGPAISHLSTVQHLTALAWAPVACAAAHRALGRDEWRFAVLAAGAIALQVLGGEAQLALYTGVAVTIGVALDPSQVRRPAAWGGVVAIGALAFCFAGPQIVATREWLGLVGEQAMGGGIRPGRGQEWELATILSWRPDTLLLGLLVPDSFGQPTEQWWVFPHLPSRFVWHAYLGVVPLVLAGWGWRGGSGRAPAVWAALGLVLALGGYGGLYFLLFHLVPGFDGFRFPDKALPFAALGVAVLAARGWDAWRADGATWRDGRDRWLWGIAAAWVLLALVVCSVGPVFSVPAILEDRALLDAAPWRWPGLRALLVVALGVGGLTFARGGRLLATTRWWWVLPVVAGLDGWLGNAGVAPTTDAAAFTHPAPQAAVFGPASPTEWRANGAWASGLADDTASTRDVRAWHRRARAHWRSYAPLLEGRATLETYETSSLLPYLHLVTGNGDLGWLGALAMRDVVAEVPLRRAELEPLQVLPDGLACYRNRLALPRARLVGALDPLPDFDTLRARVRVPGYPHPTQAPVIGAEIQPYAAALGGLDPAAAAAGRVRILADHGDEVLLDVEAPGRVVCVLADWDYPGWSVQVDGARAPLLLPYGVLRGTVVPAGRHLVRFALDAQPVWIGLALALVGALGALGWGWRRRVPTAG